MKVPPDGPPTDTPPAWPPPGPPAGVDPQRWWAWWWQTYGYPQGWQQTQAWQQARGQYWPPGYGYATPAYPQWQPAPRKRRRGVTGLVVFLILLVVLSPVALFAVGYYAGGLESSAGGHDPAAAAGPTPVEGASFRPNDAQRAYFREVAFDPDAERHAVKWREPTVSVAIEGSSTVEDRRIVDEILATVNATIDRPEFVYSTDDPDVVISIVDHETFAREANEDDEAIGWCNSRYSSTAFTIWDAEILVDGSPEYRDVRSAILYHELGHALGLTDTDTERWDCAIMYYVVDDPARYTALDLAAIGMLYDPRVEAGDTVRDVADLWPPD